MAVYWVTRLSKPHISIYIYRQNVAKKQQAIRTLRYQIHRFWAHCLVGFNADTKANAAACFPSVTDGALCACSIRTSPDMTGLPGLPLDRTPIAKPPDVVYSPTSGGLFSPSVFIGLVQCDRMEPRRFFRTYLYARPSASAARMAA